MKLFLIGALFLVLSQLGFADTRTKSLIAVINEELQEVSRLSNQLGHRDPVLLLRLAELHLEKARILKEIENEKFLKLTPKQRSRISKSRMFASSRKHFLRAQRIGIKMIQSFKNFKGRGAIYYILAFNEKEFNRLTKARRYFEKAVKFSKPNGKVNQKSKIALAELYYNEGDYNRAIPLYEVALARKRNKWWTKDAFNLAWCYFQTKQYQKAIRKILEVNRYSKQRSYIDMTSQVERDIALFYTHAGQVDKAVSFYKSQGRDIGRRLVTLAKYLIDNSKKTTAERILIEAERQSVNRSDLVEVYLLSLKLYDQYGNTSRHLEVSKKLLKVHQQQPLKDNEYQQLLYHVKKMSALLQKQAVGSTYQGVSKTRKVKAEQATEYFNIVSVLESKKSYEALFHTAETQYAIANYDKAIEFYEKAYNAAAATKNAGVQRKCVEGMLAALGQDKVSKNSIEKYLLPTYLKFLNLERRTKKANTIYQKVFNIYLEQEDIYNAIKVLDSFKGYFPSDLITQEAMVAKIMEYHRKRGNVRAVKAWANKIQVGGYRVSNKYKRSLKELLLNMQFSDVEKLTSKGDKVNALRGYIAIFRDETSTAEAKRNAAYNIAALYYELGRVDSMYKWGSKAVDDMTADEVKKFDKSFLTMTNLLFNRRRINESEILSSKLFEKLCNQRSYKKGTFFKNSYVLLLAQNKWRDVKKLVQQGKKCQIKNAVLREANIEVAKYLYESKRWDSLSGFLLQIENDPKVAQEIIEFYFSLYEVHLNNGRTGKANQYKSKIENTYKKNLGKVDFSLNSLDAVAHFKLKELDWYVKQLGGVNLRFPENTFNSIMKKKFSMLDDLTGKGIEVLKIGSGVGIVKSYQLMVEAYQKFAADVRGFVPTNKSQAYIKSFQKSMQDVTQPLINKSKDFIREAQKQISQSNILSRDNYWFFAKDRLPILLEYRYSKFGVLMDKGGKR